jgi:hypothetical protein
MMQRKGFDDVRTGHIGHVIYQGSFAGQFHNRKRIIFAVYSEILNETLFTI